VEDCGWAQEGRWYGMGRREALCAGWKVAWYGKGEGFVGREVGGRGMGKER